MRGDQHSEPKPRRWWIAASLAVLFPYVGYIYLGRPKRAVTAAAIHLALWLATLHGLWGFVARPVGFTTLFCRRQYRSILRF